MKLLEEGYFEVKLNGRQQRHSVEMIREKDDVEWVAQTQHKHYTFPGEVKPISTPQVKRERLQVYRRQMCATKEQPQLHFVVCWATLY